MEFWTYLRTKNVGCSYNAVIIRNYDIIISNFLGEGGGGGGGGIPVPLSWLEHGRPFARSRV